VELNCRLYGITHRFRWESELRAARPCFSSLDAMFDRAESRFAAILAKDIADTSPLMGVD
jgi:hypothetical protein